MGASLIANCAISPATHTHTHPQSFSITRGACLIARPAPFSAFHLREGKRGAVLARGLLVLIGEVLRVKMAFLNPGCRLGLGVVGFDVGCGGWWSGPVEGWCFWSCFLYRREIYGVIVFKFMKVCYDFGAIFQYRVFRNVGRFWGV